MSADETPPPAEHVPSVVIDIDTIDTVVGIRAIVQGAIENNGNEPGILDDTSDCGPWEEVGLEIEKLLRKKLTAGPDKVLRCAFCGDPYPEGTPTHKHAALAAHIRICPEHPIGKENRSLRAVLIEAVPWVEAQLDDPVNKPGAVRAVAARMRAALWDSEGA